MNGIFLVIDVRITYSLNTSGGNEVPSYTRLSPKTPDTVKSPGMKQFFQTVNNTTAFPVLHSVTYSL